MENPPACRQEVIEEGCTLRLCTSIASLPVTPPNHMNVGRIDIRSDSRRTVLSPDENGLYQGMDFFLLWTRSGETISVEYTFAGHKVIIDQIAPATISLHPIARRASRSAPLSVSWTGARPHDGGRIDITVGSTGDAPNYSVTCSAPPTAERLSFSPAMLSRLSAGQHNVAAFSTSLVIDELGVENYIEAIGQPQSYTVELF